MSFVYDKFRDGVMRGYFDFSSDTFRAVLVNESAYTPDSVNDEFLSDIPSGGRIVTTPDLVSGTLTNGVYDADDVTLSSVTGASISSLVIYKWTGSAATSRLVVRYDDFSGFPFSPTGGSVIIIWPNTANKIIASANN